MLDTKICGGTIVDGTGAVPRPGDLGIRDGRVEAIAPPGGLDDAQAARTIDATGRFVAPGFIDVHTHYDAQLFWDGTASPSPLHGVTTVLAGNCGFSIAPLTSDQAGYLSKMLARVEGIPLEALEAGVPWNWTTTAEYFDRLDSTLSVNAGFMAGHSAIRRVALGERANAGPANADELERMKRLLRESLEAGALGFSSSWATTHNDADGDLVPSRYASDTELVELCRVLGEFEGTGIEFIPTVEAFTNDHLDLMTRMSTAAQRPLNWNLLPVTARSFERGQRQLRAGDHAAKNGGKVVALTIPIVIQARLSFATGMVLDALPGWKDTMALPYGERIELFSKPDERERLEEGAQRPGPFRGLSRWETLTVQESFAPATRAYSGMTVGEIAEAEGKSPFDALLDIVVADELRTVLAMPRRGDSDEDWRARVKVWRDGRAVIGGSDAGAHLDILASFYYATGMLEEAVRKRALLPLEEAVQLLTDVQAQLYGLRGRGRIASGFCADLVVFDLDSIGPGPVHTRTDLPAGASRLYGEARGIDHVLVNGVEIVRDGTFTDARPGTVLRSGRDTATPALG